MTQYLLGVYQPDGEPPADVDLHRIMADVDAVTRAMRDAGVWVFAAGLAPASTATVVRGRDGSVVTTDGPYLEGKEHLGGFTVIDAPDLDVALDWAGRVAAATTLPIEVRPLQGG